MASSDLNMLVDMGFDQERANIALKKSGSLQNAIDWLEKNQDKSLDDIKVEDAAGDQMPPADAAEARSLRCNECGKLFRGTAQAEWHASKTEHTDFEESTEEIKPLTEEEKAAKLAALKEKLAAKRAGQSDQDKLDKKQNEEIRRKATKESQDAKEALQAKERIKEAQAKRREKQEEIEARKRVQAKIEEQKEARRLKAEREKAARAGQAPPVHQPAAMPTSSGPTTSKPASEYTEARLRLQTPNGTVQKTLPVETTLFELAHQLAQENGTQVTSFTQNFPRKVFDQTDFGQTLKEAGMVPSAALIVK
ncbi:uncharacterized protein K452DRAFT_350800 [Aplosporella prunicola CBS 121167]|uniref:C2H2-type domain-containing protein n=1 Tax=Aplosporella prunicola CBS 121167 TaxID=1176127 RepID=A0A6A6BE29_9PEZI|nr:uncharacterized protein K452DRAFT_350800 [Aplosporella prunicola CBS 121167]KAF2142420.1 hypothetical protein K452DRAFT_350800 [Aplosporella prunicola CBS 121167]